MSSEKAGNGLPNLPRHVAVIMDGNGRWAKKRTLNRVKGHEKGADAVRTIVRATREIGIPHLTLYAFSTENWRRPQAEIKALMALLKRFIRSERSEMLENGVRLNAIGDIARLPKGVRAALSESMEVTSKNSRLLLTLALSYGGREEITRAVRNIAQKAKDAVISPEDVTEDLIAGHLYTKKMPDPDLMIRTSGEMRTSNFLPWQLAYAEFVFTPTLWPDFSKEEYLAILGEFGARERRFGKTGDQITT